jgi:major membrane immunogen (membrane-anchored lipoprotein)
MKAAFIVCAAALLAACGEKPQEVKGVRTDLPPYQGTGVASFTESGWKAGDKDGWANHLKARATYGQNDHARAPK